ncbi:hypothetical protein K2Q08_02185 [Patescibacteria group bacterium]|nr:hypothetical protein [Patescibacteria group bacterium]
MIAFYATRSQRSGWGQDHLGNDILEPGYRIKLNLADGTGACVFDLKAVMEGGEEIIRYGLNVCTTDWWRVYDR